MRTTQIFYPVCLYGHSHDGTYHSVHVPTTTIQPPPRIQTRKPELSDNYHFDLFL